MSRYIRTKDGKIYDITKCISENYPFNPNDEIFWEFESVAVYENEVSKEADTIEELCDEYVLKATINGQTEYLHDKNLKILEICKIAHEGTGYSCETYGAIWTDKGLIYRAKMNSEGVLKLL